MGLAPLVLWLVLSARFEPAFWVFMVAGLTDAFDGFAARRLGVTSEFGRLLDPLADKILMNSTYIALAVVALVPAWLAGLVLLRDLLMASIVTSARFRHAQVPLSPLPISKTNTGLQVFLAAMVLAAAAFAWPIAQYMLPLAMLVGGLTIASGFVYLYRLLQDRKAP
jgi:cardiolipin synthase